jgi:uncharacterized protein YcbK (DUF882 family)
MRLSNNFYLKEFTKSSTAIRHGLNNTPNATQIENLQVLCYNVLQPIRDEFGPFSPSSGYRSIELNDIIGGSRNSQHTRGEAADIEVSGVSNVDLYKWIVDNCEFDQVILEYYEKGDPHSGWVHVSSKNEDNRAKKTVAFKENGKTQYRNIETVEDLEKYL